MIHWYLFCFAICLLDLLPLFFREPFPFSASLPLSFLCSFRSSSFYIVHPTVTPTVKCWFLFCFVLLRFLFFSLFYTTLLYIFTELFCFCSVSVVNLCMCVHANVLCMCVFCSVLNLYSIKHDYHHCSFLLFILFYTSVTEFVIFCFGL